MIGDVVVLLGIPLFLIAWVFFVITLRRSLILTQQHHAISPESIWILLIPLLNAFWIFYIVGRVAEGIKGRYQELQKECGDGGTFLGYWLVTFPFWGAILLWLLSSLDNSTSSILIIGSVLSAYFVGYVSVLVGYWLKIRSHIKVFEEAAR